MMIIKSHIVFLILSSLLILSVVHSHKISSDHDKLVTRISNQYYDRLLKEVENGKYQSLKSDGKGNIVYASEALRRENGDNVALTSDISEHFNSIMSKGYDCQHDEIMNSRFTLMKERLRESSKLQTMNVNHNDDSFTEAAITPSKLKKSIQSTNAGRTAIRINFNMTYLNADVDVGYSCKTVGQKIRTGSPPDGDDGSQPPACNNQLSYCTYTCRDIDILDADLIDIIKNHVIPAISDSFQSMILVDRPNPDRLVLNSAVYNAFDGFCDYGVKIPSAYTTTGGAPTETDFVVWVTARPTPSNSTIAYALACNFPVDSSMERITGKPIAASINFNPLFYTQFLNASSTSLNFNSFIRVGIHEMTHALGFSATFFPYYQSSAIKQAQISGSTPNGQSYSYSRNVIVSPNVVSFVRDHYGCSSAQYAELEDIGGSGTASSHWEKRTAGEEYMIGFVSPIAPITNLTMSLLKDSGWYDIDGDNVEPLIWGRNTGCDWMKNCYADTWNYQGYFCNAPNTKSCTATRMGKGTCLIFQYSGTLQPQYQHFSNPTYGGDQVADFCPYYQVYSSLPSTGTVYCVDQDQQSNANKDISEIYGQNSRCFEYTSNHTSNIGQACWQQRCNGTKVEIQVGSQWYRCENDLQSIYVNDEVTIVCPAGSTECGGVPQQVDLISSSSQLTFNIFMILTLSSLLNLL